MGLLYTRFIQLAIENCFLCDAICLLACLHRRRGQRARRRRINASSLLSTRSHVSPAIPASMVR